MSNTNAVTRLVNAPLPATAWLVMQSGSRAGEKFDLRPRSTKIGRVSSCTIVIEHDTISREHAKIMHLGNGHYAVIDLGSLNGTSVNDVRIDRAMLNDGDVISVGSVKLKFKSAK